MSTRLAMIALRRFGLGARAGDIAKAASDPRGYVLASFDRRQEILLDDPDLEPSHVTLSAPEPSLRTSMIGKRWGGRTASCFAMCGPRQRWSR